MSMENDPDLPNRWAIQSLIPSSTTGRSDDLSEFAKAHTTTYKKFKFAVYHWTIFHQIYGNKGDNFGSGRFPAFQDYVKAEAHSIIFNLFSALDSVSNEINLAYDFQLKRNDISINNKSLKYMLKYENDSLNTYLNDSLYRQEWFSYFNKLRNQMTHRDLFIAKNIIGGSIGLPIQLPDDPNDQSDNPPTSKRIDLGEYCEKTTKDVRQVIEGVYSLIIGRVKSRYGLSGK